jgi:hypothetical protein
MDYEPSIKYFFESLGYTVEKIDEGNDESPDFLVFDDSSSYIVELKTKFVAEEVLAHRQKTLSEGEIHQVMEPLAPKNRFSGIIRKAQSQLNAHHLSGESFRVVWLLATGHLAEPAMEQFEATLYGSTTVCDWSDNSECKTCFFFYNSDFYRYSDELDAAIVSTESGARLLLNPYSDKFEAIKISTLPAHLGTAVVDPIKLAADGDAYIIEGDVDRNDKQAVLKYLREKHNSEKILDMTMNFMSGTMAVPKNDNSN